MKQDLKKKQEKFKNTAKGCCRGMKIRNEMIKRTGWQSEELQKIIKEKKKAWKDYLFTKCMEDYDFTKDKRKLVKEVVIEAKPERPGKGLDIYSRKFFRRFRHCFMGYQNG